MSLNNDYFITATVKQHHHELLAQAETDRLARQLPRRRSWLRRLFAAKPAINPAPVQPEVAKVESEITNEERIDAEQKNSDAAAAHRVPVGAGRVSSI